MNNSHWEYLFPGKILARGKDYYKQGQVRLLIHDDYLITATVLGTARYNVKINFNDFGEIDDMYCSCPFACDGAYCKHMAAVLYYAEANFKPSAKEASDTVKLSSIVPEFDDDDFFFDIKKMARMKQTTEDNLKKAIKLFNDKSTDFSTETYYRNDIYDNKLCISVRAKIPGPRHDTIAELHCSKNEILSTSCTCQNGYSYYYNFERKKLCEHVVCAFMFLSSYVKEKNPGDDTDLSGARLLFNSHLQEHIHINKKARRIILDLRIIEEYGEFSYGLRCGIGKLFMVKNFEDLITAVENKGTYALGKNDSIDFAVDSIAEEYIPIYSFARKQFINFSSIESRYAGNICKNKGQYYITKANIDDIYNIASTIPTVYYNNDYGIKGEPVITKNENYQLSLKAKKMLDSSGIPNGISVTGTIPRIYNGVNYGYFIKENVIYRVTKENLNTINEFNRAGLYNEINFVIGKKRFHEFFYSLVPHFKNNVTFDMSDVSDLEDTIAPDISLSFYLDSQEGIPSCEIKAKYGENEYRLTSLKPYSGYDFANRFREKEAVDIVKNFFPIPGDENFFCLSDNEAVFELLDNGIPTLLELGEVNATDRFDSLKIKRKLTVSIGVSIKSDLMELDISTNDVSPQELVEILESCKLKKKYHRLKSGGFIKIDDTVEELNKIIDNLHISSKSILKQNINIPAYRALYLDSMLSEYHDIDSEKDKRFKNFIKNFKTVKESDFEIVQSLKGIMRDYQKFGHKWLRTVTECGFGGILADDMGLGKTLQVISVFLSAKNENTALPSLVVCPASLVYNWESEIQKFAPELSVGIVSGSVNDRKSIISNADNFDVLVTSYDLLKRDISEYDGVKFNYHIIDEAQNIKNHNTAASKSVKVISSEKRIALTGTPIENRLSELWSIFDFLMPGFLYGYDVFRREFETPIVKNQNSDAASKLKNMISPFILRRLKNDVLKDLPEKTEEIRFAQFEETQQKIYDGQVVKMCRLLENETDEGFASEKLQILAELTKIRRICCDPNLVFENYEGKSAKRTECINLINEAISGGHKILVFSQFTSMLDLLKADLANENIPYYIITGATDKHMRTDLVQKFNEDDTPVFLISLKAGGTGLNLTGADIVIHYDPWWNVAVQNQATDRAHRIGQKNKVTVYKLIAKNSIEEKIINMQIQKSELADALINENSGAFSLMSKDDILKLLSQ